MTVYVSAFPGNLDDLSVAESANPQFGFGGFPGFGGGYGGYGGGYGGMNSFH